MTKKKAKSETAAKKPAKAKSATKSRRDSNPADVRKKVSKMVKEKAVAMAEKVIGKTAEGVPEDLQLATVKYLFEVASIFPPEADQDSATEEEDCLAKTLLRRLNIPEEPIRRDEDEEDEVETSAEKSTATVASEDAGKNPDTESGGAGKDPEVA